MAHSNDIRKHDLEEENRGMIVKIRRDCRYISNAEATGLGINIIGMVLDGLRVFNFAFYACIGYKRSIRRLALRNAKLIRCVRSRFLAK